MMDSLFIVTPVIYMEVDHDHPHPGSFSLISLSLHYKAHTHYCLPATVEDGKGCIPGW